MSIQSEIDRLTAAKASIAASLQAMGAEPPAGSTLDQYAAQLAAIAAAAPWLPLAGGTMTGNIQMGGSRITGVGEPQADTDAARKGDLPAISTASATLYSGSWTLSGGKYAQTVQISGVKATGQNVRLSPVTKADADAWAAAGCWCTAQGSDSLTFTCETVPTQDIQLNVEMQEVQS